MRTASRLFVDNISRYSRKQFPELWCEGVLYIVVVFMRRSMSPNRRGNVHLAYRRNESDDFNAMCLPEIFLCNRPRGYAAYNVKERGNLVLLIDIRFTMRNFGAKINLPMVSRALLRPPPLLAFMPYFSRYV